MTYVCVFISYVYLSEMGVKGNTQKAYIFPVGGPSRTTRILVIFPHQEGEVVYLTRLLN